MTALCSVPDIEELREHATLPPPLTDLDGWITSAPPCPAA